MTLFCISMNNFTKHARERCQQRGIPYEVVNFIIKHGETINTHKQTKHFIKKTAMDFLRRDFPKFTSRYDKQLVTTAIVTSGKNVITAMKIEHHFRW